MKRNIRVVVEYEGTAYHGWQYQKNMTTVQGCLEDAIFELTGERLRVTASGRTDAGVHARGQVANFKLAKDLPMYSIEMGLNYHLPDDISVRSAEVVAPEFNARFDATRRTYQYYISTERTALMRAFCWQLFQKIDTSLLNPLAEKLLGDHDFGAFSRVQVESTHKRCIVYESFWRQEENVWIYRVGANRFLHGMVRTIVGTIIDVARGKSSEAEFEKIFASRNRKAAGAAAPAKGLVLEKVDYN